MALSQLVPSGVTIVLILLGFCFIPSVLSSSSNRSTEVSLRIVGMSINDHPSLTKYWWRQVIPSYYEYHMNKLNITLDDEWDGHTQCRPRYFALVHNHQRGHEHFLHGGTGVIRHTYEKQEAEMMCYYKTNFGTYVFPAATSPASGRRGTGGKTKPVDQEGFIAVTIYCPIWERDVKHIAFCDYLESKVVASEIILLSSNSSTEHMAVIEKRQPSRGGNNSVEYDGNRSTVSSSSSADGSGDTDHGQIPHPSLTSLLSPSPSSSPTMHASMSSSAGVLLTRHNKNISSSARATPSLLTVCTVQTYTSPLSGPMLWLFAQYYHAIGFRVVIYDRYGRHLSYLRDLIAQGRVYYHPYTAFELAQPDVYTTERARQEGTEYKMYYSRENPKIVMTNDTSQGTENTGVYAVANNTLQQDRDKVYTLDSARLQYGTTSRVFLAVDSDEFLVPEGRLFSLDGFRKDLTKKYFSERALRGQEEMFLVRRSVPGVSLHAVMNISDKVEHVRNFHRLSKCFLEGYRNRSAVAMSGCYGSYSVMYDRFGKYIDTRQTCSFHYLHDGCNKPKKPPSRTFTPYSVTHLASKHIGVSSSNCFCSRKKGQYDGLFLAHLNHNHFLTCFRKPRHPKQFVQQGPNSLTLALQEAAKKPNSFVT